MRAAAWLVCLSACSSSSTELVVVVSTEGLDIPNDVESIHVSSVDKADPSVTFDSQRIYLCGTGTSSSCHRPPIRIGLQPGSAHPEDGVLVRVEALRGETPVISDAASFNFTIGQTLRLDFVLRKECLGTDCASLDQSCIDRALCAPVSPAPYHDGPPPDAGVGDAATRAWVTTSRVGHAIHGLGAYITGNGSSASIDFCAVGADPGVVCANGDTGSLDFSSTSTGAGLIGYSSLSGIWFTPFGPGFAVGASPQVAQWSSSTGWVLDVTPGSAANLDAVSGNDTDVWAVGANGTVVHRPLPAGSWTAVNTGVTDELRGVAAAKGVNEAVAVGDNGRVLLIAPNGGIAAVSPSPTARLNAVAALRDGGFFIAGSDGAISTLRLGGAMAPTVPAVPGMRPLTAICATADLGDTHLVVGNDQGAIYHSINYAPWVLEVGATGDGIGALYCTGAWLVAGTLSGGVMVLLVSR